MFISGNVIKRILKTLIVAAICIVATFCMTENVKALDDEAAYTRIDRENITLPDDIEWNDRYIKTTDKNNRKIEYVLKDKMLNVYINGQNVWQTNNRYFVQDVFVEDIDSDRINKGSERISNKSDEEIVVLLWKEGRYGNHRPFWVMEDEKAYSQHLFVYNVDGDKIRPRWGSSYMGEETSSMEFKDGILFLKHSSDNSKEKRETAWEWISFGFEKIDPVNIFVAGDNLMHDPIYKDAIDNHNSDYEYIYEKIEKYTKKADLSIINLETPLVYDPSNYSTYPCFGTPVEDAKGIKDAGFDVVTLSTNHRLDKGVKGITETIQAVEENDLMHVGSMDEKPYILIKRNNIVFALMNYTYGTNGIRTPKGYENAVNYLDDEDRIREEIREAKNNSDFVMVFPHWGTEYRTTPDASQEKWRDVFYEEGVDAVIGTHPHVYQKCEYYKTDNSDHSMLIFYSLGNYISANQRKDHNSGAVASFNVNLTSEGPKISEYYYYIIDTMYKSSKYKDL